MKTENIEKALQAFAESIASLPIDLDQQEALIGLEANAYAELAALKEENERLRELLAFAYCRGALLYGDDGELQDSRKHPTIDFKRDPAGIISEKMHQRAALGQEGNNKGDDDESL